MTPEEECGCSPNDSSLLQGEPGEDGNNGLDATCQDGTNAKSRIDTSFGSCTCSTASTYSTIAYIIYPGTVNLPQAITNILVIASTTTSAQVRVVSPLGVVAETSIFNGGPTLLDLGTIDQTKLDSSYQILEIQAYANSGQVQVYAFSMLSI